MIIKNVQCPNCGLEYAETQDGCHNCGYPNRNKPDYASKAAPDAIAPVNTDGDEDNDPGDMATFDGPLEQTAMIVLHMLLGPESVPGGRLAAFEAQGGIEGFAESL